MILYHGTTLEHAEKIFQEGKIKCRIERNYKGYRDVIDGTTDGFVYLTRNLHTAYFYGNIALSDVADKKSYVYIFKIDLPDEGGFEPDYDELKVWGIRDTENITAEESLERCGAVRISKDINIAGMEYTKLPGTFNFIEDRDAVNLCRDLSAIQVNKGNGDRALEEEIENRWKWKKIDK